jgi:hypothetical protein
VTVHAWAAGGSAQLHRRQLPFATTIAAGLGLAMIVLKTWYSLRCTYVHSGWAARSDTHMPERIDYEVNRHGQAEDHSAQRQEDTYNGGAGLEPHC